MHLISSLLVLLVVSRLLGRLFVTIGQLAIVGEILAGLLLGPVILNLIQASEQLMGVVQLGVFLLIFSAGLEMEMHEILAALRKKAALGALFGFSIPLATGVGIGHLFGLSLLEGFIIGLCLAITALPVAIRMLESFNLLDEAIGHTVIGAAIIIDIIALLILGILFDAPESIEARANYLEMVKSISITALKMLGFFGIILFVNKYLRSGLLNVKRAKSFFRTVSSSFGEEGIFGISILFVLVFSFVSESLGLHFIIGAFFGGLLLNTDIMGKDFFLELEKTLGSFTNAFFAPIFFASIGMQLSLAAFDRVGFLLLTVALGYFAKLVGTWIGSKLGGMTTRESLQMGILLNSRGVLDLVVADLALEAGYISTGTFSILVIVSVMSSVLTPTIYKIFLVDKKFSDEETLLKTN